MFPISHSRTAAGPHQSEKDFAFIKKGRTDRATVTNELGNFTVFYDDLNIGYYAMNRVSAKVLWLAFPGIPIGTRNWDGGLDATMVRFDARGIVRQRETFMEWNPEYKIRERAEEWAQQGGRSPNPVAPKSN